MEIHVHTDSSITGTEKFAEHVTTTVGARLARFGDYLTRVEIHLADESAGRTTDADQRCMIEARPAGHQPIAVTSRAATVDEALGTAIHKLTTVLAREIGRRDDHKGAASIRTGRDGDGASSTATDPTAHDVGEDGGDADTDVHQG